MNRAIVISLDDVRDHLRVPTVELGLLGQLVGGVLITHSPGHLTLRLPDTTCIAEVRVRVIDVFTEDALVRQYLAQHPR